MLLWFIIMDLRGDLLMLIHADREKLLELAKDFYAVCHTMISIYDANKKPICSYPDKMCDFCAEIRKSPTLTARCIHCDEIALAECEATRKTHSYKCHMGLIETAVPIISNMLRNAAKTFFFINILLSAKAGRAHRPPFQVACPLSTITPFPISGYPSKSGPSARICIH